MSPSKTGLNAEFYKWIDDVRRAMRKEKELQEKLRYYNMKLTSCRGMTYDRIGSAGTAGGERDLYYWIERTDGASQKLAKATKVVYEYTVFLDSLSRLEQEALNQFVLIWRNTDAQRVNRIRQKGLIGNVARAWSSIAKK